mmetsp:Transcript_52851/g.126395  ORF Transcript_52851/g.126395 Transcript_52851/m.126395 type:complete len:210 (-) Transcript_52851:88-717(-)
MLRVAVRHPSRCISPAPPTKHVPLLRDVHLAAHQQVHPASAQAARLPLGSGFLLRRLCSTCTPFSLERRLSLLPRCPCIRLGLILRLLRVGTRIFFRLCRCIAGVARFVARVTLRLSRLLALLGLGYLLPCYRNGCPCAKRGRGTALFGLATPALGSAPIAACGHLVPASLPLFPPGKGTPTNNAVLDRKVVGIAKASHPDAKSYQAAR